MSYMNEWNQTERKEMIDDFIIDLRKIKKRENGDIDYRIVDLINKWKKIGGF